MRHTSASIIAMTVMAIVVFMATSGSTPMPSAPSNLGGSAIAYYAAPAPRDVSLVLANDVVRPYSKVSVTDERIVVANGELESLTIELLGSEGEHVTFRMQPTANPETYDLSTATTLPTKRNPDGVAYASVSSRDLAATVAAWGAGWYIFTAERASGDVLAIPIHIQG